MSDEWNIDEAALELSCPYCHAPPGKPCVIVESDRPGRARPVHTMRRTPLDIAYSNGYADAQTDLLSLR